jgi:hypothetical protein
LAHATDPHEVTMTTSSDHVRTDAASLPKAPAPQSFDLGRRRPFLSAPEQVKRNNDATDSGQDQAPATRQNTGRSAHHQPQDSADLVSRITATGEKQLRWLTPQALPGLQPRPCADAGESVPGLGRTPRGRAVVAGAVPAPRYVRAINDGAGYLRGIRIQDRRPQRTPHRGLTASRQEAGHVVASRLGELTTRERQRSSSAL